MDSTQRFSYRAADYVKYRPGYPKILYDFLVDRFTLSSEKLIADIGSGTGKFTLPLLERGLCVQGVEPNREMREAGEQLMSQFPNFTSINGTAEATTLPDASVDLVTAVQAVHWFDIERTRAEFKRILKSGGSVCMIWNQRDESRSAFLQDYKALLAVHAPSYGNHGEDAARVEKFFAAQGCEHKIFEHRHAVDFDGLMGSLRSASHISLEPSAQAALAADARKIFERHQRDGLVWYEFNTNLYFGQP